MTIRLVEWSLHAKSPFDLHVCNHNGSLNVHVDVTACGVNLETRQRGRPQILPKLPPLLLGGPSGWRSSRPPSPAGIRRTLYCNRCVVTTPESRRNFVAGGQGHHGQALRKKRRAAHWREKYGQVIKIRSRMRADTASCGLDSHHTINNAGTGLTNKKPSCSYHRHRD